MYGLSNSLWWWHGCSRAWFASQVVLYVDGVRIGEAAASGDTPHHIIHRLCEIDMDMAGDMQQPAQQGVGFTLKLPELQQGRHEVRFCHHFHAGGATI